MSKVEFRCNGVMKTVEASGDRLLLDVLREDLGLTGAKLGCGTGDCGACTALLDGFAVNSCLVYVMECAGAEIDTVEGIATTVEGCAVIDAFEEYGAVQCGICTPGFVVAAVAGLREAEGPLTVDDAKRAIAGNLCRCTGYFPIVDAVVAAGRDVEVTA